MKSFCKIFSSISTLTLSIETKNEPGGPAQRLCLTCRWGETTQGKRQHCLDCVIETVSRVAGIDEVSGGQLYHDLILCEDNQILSSLNLLVSSQPRDRIEHTSHWKSFISFGQQSGGDTV